MATPQRLPLVNNDDGVWGDIIRQYIMKEHYNDDTNNPANGGHQHVTVRPGTTAAGTAPLKFASGPLMSNPEVGAVEFLTDAYYGTISTGVARKTFAFLESPIFTGTITAPLIKPATDSTTPRCNHLNHINSRLNLFLLRYRTIKHLLD